MERQDTVYRRYPLSNTSLPGRYARAIATYLHGDLNNALTQIDGLIQVQPNNAYFYELRVRRCSRAAAQRRDRAAAQGACAVE